MPIDCFTATMLAVPPTQLPPSAATGCQPSPVSHPRYRRKDSTKAIASVAVAVKNTASTLGPSARMARRSQSIISRNTSAGTSREMASEWVLAISGVVCHSPATARAVTSR